MSTATNRTNESTHKFMPNRSRNKTSMRVSLTENLDRTLRSSMKVEDQS